MPQIETTQRYARLTNGVIMREAVRIGGLRSMARGSVIQVLTDRWFLFGVLLGLIAVLPKVLHVQFGVDIAPQGEIEGPVGLVMMLAGLAAVFWMIAGVFSFQGRLFYPMVAIGVIFNGAFFAVLGYAIRDWRRRAAASSKP